MVPKYLRELTNVKIDVFKQVLDKFLQKVLDEQQLPGYTAHRRVSSNSLIDMINTTKNQVGALSEEEHRAASEGFARPGDRQKVLGKLMQECTRMYTSLKLLEFYEETEANNLGHNYLLSMQLPKCPPRVISIHINNLDSFD